MYKKFFEAQYLIGDEMKKTILLVIFILTFYIVSSKIVSERVVIPKEAIRIRIIPNSNEEYDINVKNEVRKNLESYLDTLMTNADNIDSARSILKNNFENIDEKINSVISTLNYNNGYKINYGLNYFPQKVFKGVTYNEGYYESIVVTLGKGLGDNWWCVLFPPLCLLEAEEETEAEYRSYVIDMINKYL